MRRWQKRNPPLVALVFFVFIALSIVYNESNIRGLQQLQTPGVGNDEQQGSQGSSLLDPKPIRSFNVSKEAPVTSLDKFTTCNETVSYSGKKHTSPVPRSEFSGLRAAVDMEGCDLFSGTWVSDNTSYPLYNESDCPYMSDQLACHKHGRPDTGYQLWRWQPYNCNLKRWNAVDMWEKLRGKRLMFVGDSLDRGQWISMLCLLQSAVPKDKQSITPNSQLTIFRAENYNASVEFLWAPLLVESNSDDPVDHRLKERILRPDAIGRHSSLWEQADILIFNSYLWWRQGPVKLLWSNEENGVCEEISGLGGMELAMESWANWVQTHVDPVKKKERRMGSRKRRQLLQRDRPYNGQRILGHWLDLATMQMVDRVLSRLGSKVSILNITQLSDYRKDGHPTIFRKFWEQLNPETLANPASYSDCIHWCLPGVPDVWNELLFHLL